MLIQQKAIATPLLQLVQEDSSTSSTILKETQSRTTAKKQLCIQQTKKQVKFGTVEIHEHLNMLGAASIPNQGAPLTIDWERQAHHIFQVDDYESYKPPPRKGDEMIYPRSCRQNMLLDLGYSMSAIIHQTEECSTIRKQRDASAKQFHFPFHNHLKRNHLKHT